MKKVLLLSLAAVGMFAVSCKKGPIKPGKLEGTWNLTSMTSSTEYDYGNGSSTTNSSSFDGTTMTIESTNTSGGSSTTTSSERTYTEYSYNFDEAGNVTITESYTEVETNSVFGGEEEETTVVNRTSTGYWNVSNKYNETYLANERISVDITTVTSESETTTVFTPTGSSTSTTTESTSSYTDNYAPGTNVSLLKVTTFDNESMTAERSASYTNSNSTTSGSTTTTNSTDVTISSTMTFSKAGE